MYWKSALIIMFIAFWIQSVIQEKLNGGEKYEWMRREDNNQWRMQDFPEGALTLGIDLIYHLAFAWKWN